MQTCKCKKKKKSCWIVFSFSWSIDSSLKCESFSLITLVSQRVIEESLVRMRNMSWLHLGLQPDVLHLCCFHWGLGTTHCTQRPNVTANRWTTQCPFSHCRALGLINSVITFTNNQTLFLAYSQIKSRFRAEKKIFKKNKEQLFPNLFWISLHL